MQFKKQFNFYINKFKLVFKGRFYLFQSFLGEIEIRKRDIFLAQNCSFSHLLINEFVKNQVNNEKLT